MGAVNPAIPTTLPARAATGGAGTEPQQLDPYRSSEWDLTDGISNMGRSLGSTLTDVATAAGARTDDEGNLRAGVDPVGLTGFAAATMGPTAIAAAGNRVDPLTGASTRYVDRFGALTRANGIRVTPTLVSAIAGPAVADGVTMLAPNLVKKYKDPRNIKDAAARKKAEKDNQEAKIGRMVAGGVAVGLAAGVVFLLKPELFSRFQKLDGTGLVDRAVRGTTEVMVDGQTTRLAGMLDAAAVRAAMAGRGTPIADGAAVEIIRTVPKMMKDAAFTNRLILGSAGGLGTLLLADRTAGAKDPEQRRTMLALTAAAGAMTVGGVWGIGKLTERSMLAANGAGGLLARNDLLLKPNVEWLKKYGTTIAPITAIPAGTAASQYYNVVSDFDDITSPRSPFRR